MAAQVHEFDVLMTCEGCSGAVTRVLEKVEEVSNIDIDMDNKKVFVTTTVSGEDILAKLKKTGRECSYVGLKQ